MKEIRLSREFIEQMSEQKIKAAPCDRRRTSRDAYISRQLDRLAMRAEMALEAYERTLREFEETSNFLQYAVSAARDDHGVEPSRFASDVCHKVAIRRDQR